MHKQTWKHKFAHGFHTTRMINEKFNFNSTHCLKVARKIEWHFSHTDAAAGYKCKAESYHILNSDFSACVTFYDYCNDYCKLHLVACTQHYEVVVVASK